MRDIDIQQYQSNKQNIYILTLNCQKKTYLTLNLIRGHDSYKLKIDISSKPSKKILISSNMNKITPNLYLLRWILNNYENFKIEADNYILDNITIEKIKEILQLYF